MSATEWTESDPSETGTSTPSPDHRVRALPGAIATVGVTVLLWMLSGPIGLVGGGVLFVSWAVLPATYAFAVGQIVFVALTRPASVTEVGLLPLALLELGLAGVLVGPELGSAVARRTAGRTLLGGALLSGVALASYALWGRVWIAATVLVGIGALGAYGLHRYELVVLGKVPESGTYEAGSDVPREPGRRDGEPAPDDGSTPDTERRDSSEEGDSYKGGNASEEGRFDPAGEGGETS